MGVYDAEAHQQAANMAVSGTALEGCDVKTIAYGLYAHIIDAEQFSDEPLVCKVDSFTSLQEALFERVHTAITRNYSSIDMSNNEQIARHSHDRGVPIVFEEADGTIRHDKMYPSVMNNLFGGAEFGTSVEIITLRTLAKLQAEGRHITSHALASSALQFRLALLTHQTELLNFYDITEHTEYAGGGKIFKQEVVIFNAVRGLRLRAPLAELTGRPSLDRAAKVVGCPVTLIRDYIARVHQLALRTSVEKGLLLEV